MEGDIVSIVQALGAKAFAYVSSVNVLKQLTAIPLVLLLSHAGSRFFAHWTAQIKWPVKISLPVHIYLTLAQIYYTLLLFTFSWLAVSIFLEIGWQNLLLVTLATIVTAWCVVRLLTSAMTSRGAAQFITVAVWSVTALSLLGWLNPLIGYLSKTTFTLGEASISLLQILKGIVFLVLAIWIASALAHRIERKLQVTAALSPSQQVLFGKLARILLIVTCIAVGLNIVGIDLTALAVFSGALGLGIGFGLQKIFSNLVSGFILLMDRSIKPGDVIAIGDTYGWVNRLGARYVSVVTRDNKEYLIPNENLITQQVENWSYTENSVRLHVPIGVSYDSDLHLVKKLLLQVVADHPRILKYPAPNCLIMGFGDSSVDHELRIWISDPQNGMANVKSEIYYAIWDVFKAHNITIPYPQREVHIKQAPPAA